MKRASSSLTLAVCAYLVLGLGYVGGRGFLGSWLSNYGIAELPLMIAVLLLTLGFATIDLRRSQTRIQAMVALGLASPLLYVYFLRRW